MKILVLSALLFTQVRHAPNSESGDHAAVRHHEPPKPDAANKAFAPLHTKEARLKHSGAKREVKHQPKK